MLKERVLLAIGVPLTIIFGYPWLMERDRPDYYAVVGFVGIALLAALASLRYRRHRKKKQRQP